MQKEVECLEAKGLQKIEFGVAGRRLRAFTTFCRWSGPGQSLPCLVAHPCLTGLGMCQPQWCQA